jgi:hypothetical protein
MAVPPPQPAARPLLADAALSARVQPVALRSALQRLGLSSAAEGLSLETLTWLGIDDTAPVHIGLRGSAPTAVARAVEDVARVLGDPPSGGLPAWLETHPLPATWLHLRVVGTHRAPPPDAEARLGAHFGALQRFTLAEPPAGVAVALDTQPTALTPLAPLADATLYRLLDAGLPTVLMRSTDGPYQVLDVIIDLDLGPGALVAGLRALPQLTDAAPGSPLAGDALLAIHTTLPALLALADATDGVETILPVLSEHPRHPAQDAWRMAHEVAQRRSATRRAGASLFTGVSLRITAADPIIEVALESPLSATGALLGALSGGETPVAPEKLRPLAPITVSWAVGPWATRLDGLPAPTIERFTFAQQVRACGPSCWTAAWTALPLYFGRQAAATFNALFPSSLLGALNEMRGASVMLDAQLQVQAAAVRHNGTPREPASGELVLAPFGAWQIDGPNAALLRTLYDLLDPSPQAPLLQVHAQPATGPFSTVRAQFEYTPSHQRLTLQLTPRPATP